jgi:hypothetical protein
MYLRFIKTIKIIERIAPNKNRGDILHTHYLIEITIYSKKGINIL